MSASKAVRRLRIAHVIPSYVPAVRYGGVVIATHGLCRALARAGHEVSVFTTVRDGDDALPVSPIEGERLEGVHVHRHALDGPRRLYYSSDLVKRLHQEAGHFDVIHGHGLFLHPVHAAYRAARRAAVPFVLSPRGMLARELFRQRSSLAKWAWLLSLGRRQLAGAGAVHLTSEIEHEELRAFPVSPARCIVIPNGIDPPTLPRVEREPHTLLFLGRLSWKKRIEVLLHALVRLPECELRIVGSDDESLTPGLRSLACRLGVIGRVHFVGAVDLEARWHEYARAGAFLLPSMSENFANTVLEAMAAGCPVVVTPSVGMSRTVARTRAGHVCDGEPGALAGAVRALLEDPEHAARMGRNGRATVEQEFLWPRLAERMAGVYESLQEGHPGGAPGRGAP